MSVGRSSAITPSMNSNAETNRVAPQEVTAVTDSPVVAGTRAGVRTAATLLRSSIQASSDRIAGNG